MQTLSSLTGWLLEFLFGEFGLLITVVVSVIVWAASGLASGLAVLALPAIIICLTLSFVDYHNKEICKLKEEHELEVSNMSRDTIDNL